MKVATWSEEQQLSYTGGVAFCRVEHYHCVLTWYRISAESLIDTKFIMLLIILAPFNIKDSAISEPLKLRPYGALYVRVLSFATSSLLLKPRLRATRQWPRSPSSKCPPSLILAIIITQPLGSTRSLSIITVLHTPIQSSLKITNQPLLSICATFIIE